MHEHRHFIDHFQPRRAIAYFIADMSLDVIFRHYLYADDALRQSVSKCSLLPSEHYQPLCNTLPSMSSAISALARESSTALTAPCPANFTFSPSSEKDSIVPAATLLPPPERKTRANS